jgi:CBS-domain-containing membrane protein
MLWTGAVHPPGGALVLIFADSAKARTHAHAHAHARPLSLLPHSHHPPCALCAPQMQALGWRYVLFPGLFGALLLMGAAAVTDELARD